MGQHVLGHARSYINRQVARTNNSPQLRKQYSISEIFSSKPNGYQGFLSGGTSKQTRRMTSNLWMEYLHSSGVTAVSIGCLTSTRMKYKCSACIIIDERNAINAVLGTWLLKTTLLSSCEHANWHILCTLGM